MHFEIRHNISHVYDAPVFLEPITLRLRPRCDWVQHLGQFTLIMDPAPDGISEYLDIEGNAAATAWFSGRHRSLSISAQSFVKVRDVNPFDFILIGDSMLSVPVAYPQPLHKSLVPYLGERHEAGRQVEEFLKPVLAKSEEKTLSFLTELTTQIHKNFALEFRESGGPLPPSETLSRGTGACRDLAVLFMECCRTMGLAARFVSGYAYIANDDTGEKQDLHAWAEVYLPGGGWRGFDPSLGLAVTTKYVPLAAAANPGDAAPISGTFRGTEVGSSLKYDVSILASE